MNKHLPSSCFILASLLLLTSSIASAHHSAAMFDATKEVTVKGTVEQFKFRPAR